MQESTFCCNKGRKAVLSAVRTENRTERNGAEQNGTEQNAVDVLWRGDAFVFRRRVCSLTVSISAVWDHASAGENGAPYIYTCDLEI